MTKVLRTSWVVTLATFDVLRILFALSFAWSLLFSIIFGLKRPNMNAAWSDLNQKN